MKLKPKLVLLLAGISLGIIAHNYVTAHRQELDDFLEEYGRRIR